MKLPTPHDVRLASVQWCLDNASRAACYGIKQRDRLKLVGGNASNNTVTEALRSIFHSCDWLLEKDEWGQVVTPEEILQKMWNDRLDIWGNSTLQHEELVERLVDIGWVTTFQEPDYDPFSGKVLSGMRAREQAELRQSDAAEVVDDLLHVDPSGDW